MTPTVIPLLRNARSVSTRSAMGLAPGSNLRRTSSSSVAIVMFRMTPEPRFTLSHRSMSRDTREDLVRRLTGMPWSARTAAQSRIIFVFRSRGW